ncbi:polyketide cyclase/dehydrase/lipid transporter [Rhynchospora pubera]|uniref:Polyketide cyclase/dehydrase/lipid transporter n=1 Tax=Rhynchospora pubera TaxID=906938 RepID=A0AAV8CQX8_9POAL|nr:polyketide cyclase/dehydrase/lipid transporter [Rhynchospora pubera]
MRMRALGFLTSPSPSPSLHPSRNPTPSKSKPNNLSNPRLSLVRIEAKTAIAIPRAQKNPDYKGAHKEEDSAHVRCDVHVHVISWRERAVHASILVHADVDSVWSVLTDYERLADFIPNLLYCGRIPCPHEGRIWLEQRGLQRALYWHIDARVVLDLQEIPSLANGRELHFSMVDGDFKKFEGKWSVQPGTRPGTAKLSYEVNVIPRFNFPAILLERIIRSNLPINLKALAFWAEKKCGEIINANDAAIDPKVPVSGLKDLSDIERLNGGADLKTDDSLSGKKWGIYGNTCSIDRPCVVDEIHLRRFDGLLENGGTHRCVFASITVKAPVREVWNVLTAYEELTEIVPNLAISKVLFRYNNKVRILQEGCKGLLYMVLHAQVILDLHEELEKEISFEQVEGDFNSFQGRWRLQQLGDRHTLLKYMVETKMHQDIFLSEAIVEEVIYEDLPSNLCAIRDYVEKAELLRTGSIDPPVTPTSPDPDSLQLLQKSLSDQVSIFKPSQRTNSRRPRVPGLQTDMEILKSEILEFISTYGQEGFMPLRKQLRLHGRVDIEKAITKMGGFRKVAWLMNLSLAYKDRKTNSRRPRVPGLQTDMEILKSEILEFISTYGQEGFMPLRKQLRLHGRVDIEKAITKMGGFRKVAWLMNLSLAYKDRKPNCYWDSLDNLHLEIRRFQSNWGMDPAYMPSRKSFERAGRYDIARALEGWGGLLEVSRLLSLQPRRPRKRSKTSASHEAQKWLMKFQDLDID